MGIYYSLVFIIIYFICFSGIDYHEKIKKKPLIHLGIFRFVFIHYKYIADPDFAETKKTPRIKDKINQRSISKASLWLQIVHYLYYVILVSMVIVNSIIPNELLELLEGLFVIVYIAGFVVLLIILVIKEIAMEKKDNP